MLAKVIDHKKQVRVSVSGRQVSEQNNCQKRNFEISDYPLENENSDVSTTEDDNSDVPTNEGGLKNYSCQIRLEDNNKLSSNNWLEEQSVFVKDDEISDGRFDLHLQKLTQAEEVVENLHHNVLTGSKKVLEDKHLEILD